MPQRRMEHAAYMRTWREQQKALAQPAAPFQEPGNPADIIREWAETKLKVPTGPLSGKAFLIPDWQHRFLADLFNPAVREAGLSVARKNGKSGLIAAVFLAYLAGPLNQQNWRGLVTSLTGRLAKELRDAIEQTASVSGLSNIRVMRSPTPGVILGARGTKLDFLAADKSTGHGSGADLALIDEAGLLQERNRSLWNAVFSCISGRDGKFGAISIQGDGPMFAEMAQRADEPEVGWHEYVTPEGVPIDSPIAWHASNPGLVDGIKSESYMRDQARRVLRSPDNEADFRAFDLNQRLDPSREVICTVSEWERCTVPDYDLPPADGPCILALDLGGSASMTAAAAAWPDTGRLETWGAFPDIPSLHERGITDGVGRRYERMEKEGLIRTFPGRITPVEPFLEWVLSELSERGITPVAIGADRYRRKEALDLYDSIGLRVPLQWRGTGAASAADGSADVRSFRKWVKSAYLKHKPSILVESAIAGSDVRRDKAGNPALDKSKQKDRIDVLQAAVIAVGLAALMPKRGKIQWAVAE